MLYIDLPEAYKDRLLSFYLAMEEFVARQMDIDDCLLMWQVGPSVIFGRNQSVESEVNLAFCKAHQINVYRRKSGGGCVYADHDNVMLSYISQGDNVGQAFNRFIQMMLLVLRRMGVEAVSASHNAVIMGDRQVSGTACYQVGGKSIVHGTLLYDTNMDYMLHAITPSSEKLHQKGIQSVRQRITLLKDHVTLTKEEVKSLFRTTLCQGERLLTSEEVTAIEVLEKEYLCKEFINKL